MSHTTPRKRPFLYEENRPFPELDHTYGHGKHISNEKLEKIAIKKFEQNGLGITYVDLMTKFGGSKPKAQLRLKNACKEKVTKHGKTAPILFRSLERKNPQIFFPFSKREQIIKNWKLKRNGPIGTTGIRLYSNDLENLSARHIEELLTLLKNEPLSIHKIHIKLFYNKIYYGEITAHRFDKKDKILHEERIGFRNINYQIYPNGTIMVYISCTNSPFKLEVEEDVSSFFSFLGQVKEILRELVHDTSEQIIPSIMNWVLVQCDVNADIPINIIEELSLPDLQLHVFDRIFRMYVKYVNGSAFWRFEESKQINKPVGSGIPEIMNTFNPLRNHPYDPIKYNYIQ